VDYKHLSVETEFNVFACILCLSHSPWPVLFSVGVSPFLCVPTFIRCQQFTRFCRWSASAWDLFAIHFCAKTPRTDKSTGLRSMLCSFTVLFEEHFSKTHWVHRTRFRKVDLVRFGKVLFIYITQERTQATEWRQWACWLRCRNSVWHPSFHIATDWNKYHAYGILL